MFIDARTVPQDTAVQTGICIIGAGAAGITLALSLRDAGFPIALLESGDLDFDSDTQNLDAGEVGALPNFPLDVSRLRFFGGTTNHWDGWCRPLDALDFQRRAAIPLSGWPLQKSALTPYYEQAQRVCQLGPHDYDADFWIRQTGQTAPKFDPARLKTAVFQVSPPTRFGQAYREQLRQSDTVSVYLNANAVDLQSNATASAVEQVKVATLGGSTFVVRAKFVVLAAGGLENARILLLSSGVQPAGLGNTYDLVGRYFMDHPWFTQAAVVRFTTPDPPLPLLFGETPLRGTTVFATLAPGDADMPQEISNPAATGGFRIVMQKLHRVIGGLDSLRAVFGSLAGFSLPPDLWDQLGSILHDRDAVADALYRAVTRQRTSPFAPAIPTTGPAVGASLDINIEQTPNPDSRVMLTHQRDALGQNRLILFWRLNDIDRRTYRRAQEMAGLEFGRLGIGRLNAKPLPDNGWPPFGGMFGSRHHMGTTRMSNDPRTGVVDATCRMHGLSNLYVAGSSVFPTSGYANPTLTIVALALRLGDELRRQMV
jgi:choline dehydrogenase-like flavoprotein